ncbi:DUF7594 domain-containing protein [Pyxidicoccus trucidator]|uniref:CBM96 family carbohydrate-binding protein n=1 Tax=Pyxidicoccus trucidator TaxID=2709662 RepID=UPI0013DB8D55|nr:DNRLRE domain-containing protein [Pyxidicoccus trucidator]
MSGLKSWRRVRAGAGWMAGLMLLTHCGGVEEAGERGESPTEAPAKQTAALDTCEQDVAYETVIVGGLEDTYVAAAQPDAANGGVSKLLVDGDPRMEAYLRFNLSSTDLRNSPVIQVRLQLYATDGSTDGPAIYSTTTNWSASSLTWNTRPTRTGEALADLGAVTTSSLVEYDVTPAVTGPGTYSFALVPTGGNGVDFLATESGQGGLMPQLAVTVARLYCTRRGTGGDLDQAFQRGGPKQQWWDGSMAVGPDGSFVVAARYEEQGHFGGDTFTSPHNFALVKYGPDGTHQWSRAHVPFNNAASVIVNALTLTPLGNVLAVGTYQGAPDFGAGPLPATPDDETWGAFIAKFSPSGAFVWARGFVPTNEAGGANVFAQGSAVTTDANGSLIVTGGFTGQLNLGGAPLESDPTYSLQGMFLAKYSWEGEHLWSLAVPAGTSNPWSDSTLGEDVVANADGRIFVTGLAGTGRLGATSYSTPFVAAYSPEGTLLWSRALNGARTSQMSLALMPGGHVAFGGSFHGTFTFAGSTVSSAPGAPGYAPMDGYLGVLTSSGGDTWARRYGSTVDDFFSDIATDSAGNISALGMTYGSVDLGGSLMGNPGGSNTLVARFSSTGTHRWSRVIDSSLYVISVGATPDGATLLPGAFIDLVSLRDRAYLPQDGRADLLFLRFAP